jgi:hypothetical protein
MRVEEKQNAMTPIVYVYLIHSLLCDLCAFAVRYLSF